MYLKRLEIHGFKSFADKMCLEFKPGITLVVGPNGSGKSNIADAIRWVLGEQSVKSLRGGKMEDVIFAGSDRKRSLGMAEVSLTIDNTAGIFPLDFNEVTVTRRLYRSGESDYLINRVPCRLRDVHELFMDTGVGREGFSMIGQGKIDEILWAKPEERRGLLEEAAGIVKYRFRKREANKKLTDTEASLVRLNDIISELSDQEEPLAEQAKKAQLYQQKKTELAGLEIGLIVGEVDASHSKLENIKGRITSESDEMEELRTELLHFQAKEEENRFSIQQKEEEIAFNQDSLYGTNIQFEKNESQRKLVMEKLAEQDRQILSLDNEIMQVQEEYGQINESYNAFLKEEQDLALKVEKARFSLENFENQIQAESKREQEQKTKLEELKNKHFDTLQEESGLKNEENACIQRITALNRQKELLEQKRQDTHQYYHQVIVKLTQLEQERQELQFEHKGYLKELGLNEEVHQQEVEKLQRVKQQNRVLLEKKSEAVSRHKVLQEMESAGQGYTDGVREILQLKTQKKLKGLIGTVAQILQVPREYELAVEVVLGGALQHILTENDQVAQEAVEWLKKHNKGRVTFLPLNTIKARTIKGLTPVHSKIVGHLSELVKCEQSYREVIDYLLGRVWLVEDLSAAVNIARETSFAFRIVTPDGQLVNAGGSITGGSIRPNSHGILGRKRTLQEIEGTIDDLQLRLNLSQKNEEEVGRSLEVLEKATARIKDNIQKLRLRDIELNNTVERWILERERLSKELESLAQQTGHLEKEKGEAETSIEELRRSRVQKTLVIAKIAQELKNLQEHVIKEQAEKVIQNEKLTNLRIEAATMEEKRVSLEKEGNHYKQQLLRLNRQLEEKGKEILLRQDSKTELQQELIELGKEQENLNLVLKELTITLENFKTKKKQEQEQLDAALQSIKKYSSALREKESKLNQLQVQISRLDTAYESSLRRLQEQYGLSYDEAKNRAFELQDRRQAGERITILKEEIEGLGQVNLAAVEEYSKLKERLDFLSVQVNDMVEAKQKLLLLIKEMDVIMIRRFKLTFEEVDRAFREMFTKLFGGGRAQLQLTDPESPLESGIEIIAQPPGKKTQSISLLSGGEKALTAIALLMGVLCVKPSPFCVLDEIESNLDEANVNRFAGILHEFSQRTQFIVISHRQGTMEAADILYGVTLDERGVSRLVSVKLEDAKKEAS